MIKVGIRFRRLKLSCLLHQSCIGMRDVGHPDAKGLIDPKLFLLKNGYTGSEDLIGELKKWTLEAGKI